MRALAAFALILMAGCGRGNDSSNGARITPTGWEYRPASGAYAASLSYVDPGREIKFLASCNGEPNFLLAGGDYQVGATQFTLTVDQKSWILPTWQGEHGRGLWVDRHEQAKAIASAKRRIVFEVGNWRREIQPGPDLKAFAAACS
jgi:hypothetical protein